MTNNLIHRYQGVSLFASWYLIDFKKPIILVIFYWF